MFSKIINAWSESQRVVENRRVMRRTAERLVWSGRGAAQVSVDAPGLVVRSWL